MEEVDLDRESDTEADDTDDLPSVGSSFLANNDEEEEDEESSDKEDEDCDPDDGNDEDDLSIGSTTVEVEQGLVDWFVSLPFMARNDLNSLANGYENKPEPGTKPAIRVVPDGALTRKKAAAKVPAKASAPPRKHSVKAPPAPPAYNPGLVVHSGFRFRLVRAGFSGSGPEFHRKKQENLDSGDSGRNRNA